MFLDLVASTTGEEPCFDPNLNDAYIMESPTDFYVESWTGRNISKETAESLCAGCDVLEQCKAYAMAAKEPFGIWGGTRPRDRGIPLNYKG